MFVLSLMYVYIHTHIFEICLFDKFLYIVRTVYTQVFGWSWSGVWYCVCL